MTSSPVPPPDRPTTAERLAQIKARVERATPEPWLYVHGYGWWSKTAGTAPQLGGHDGPRTPDIDFVTEARADVPFLLERIEELEKELQEVRERYEAYHATD